MAGDDLLHHLHPLLNSLRVVRGTILSQQVLQHVGRHAGIALDAVGEVFPHHSTGKKVVYLFVR